MTVDYKSTVFLPRSDFPMRAKLAEREPEMLSRWQKMKLFDRLRAAAKGREKFILHDGLLASLAIGENPDLPLLIENRDAGSVRHRPPRWKRFSRADRRPRPFP